MGYSDRDFCAEKLRDMLADGKWHECEEIREQMIANGIPNRTFKQVRRHLRIETKNEHGKYYWRLV